MPKQKITCGKCGGRGHLPEYAGIRQGVCFSCNGLGYTLRAANWRPSIKFPIHFIHDGADLLVRWVSAKSAEEALKKAKAKPTGIYDVATMYVGEERQ